jgi:uncharacterized membrane protein YwzB
MKTFQRFLWAISGHQHDIISETKVDSYRATIVGAILLMVGIYATLAWTFFFSLVMTNFLIAMVCGLFAGFFILLFDRALICSISYGKKNIWALSFRFALALILGVFLSQPIILKLYEPDIKREAVILIDKKNQERRGELDKLYSTEVKNLQERRRFIFSSLSEKQKQLITNEESFKKEMDGSAGTGRWGYNTVSQKKESIYKKDLAEYDQLKKETEPEVKRIDARIDTLQALINNQLASFEKSTQNQGFLIQAEALQSLLIKDTTHTLRNRYYLLMVILTLIELSALISKLILDTSSYSKKVDYILEKEKMETAMDKEIIFSKLDIYKKLTLEREQKIVEEFFEKTSEPKDSKLDKIIGDWSTSETQTYRNTWGILNDQLIIHPDQHNHTPQVKEQIKETDSLN